MREGVRGEKGRLLECEREEGKRAQKAPIIAH